MYRLRDRTRKSTGVWLRAIYIATQTDLSNKGLRRGLQQEEAVPLAERLEDSLSFLEPNRIC